MKTFLVIIPFFIFSCAQSSKKLSNTGDATMREDVRRTLRSKLSPIKDCFMKEYNKNPKLAGKMVFDWEVHQGGLVKNVMTKPDATSLKNGLMEACISDVIAKTQFPEPAESTFYTVSYPFVFESNSASPGVSIHQ